MTKSRIKALCAAVAAASLLPVLAFAAERDHCDMPQHGMHAMHDEKFMDGPQPPFLHGLDLSEAQRDAIFNIMHNQAPLLRDKMKSLHKAEETLRTLTLSSQYDDTKAKALAEEAADSMAVLALLRAQSEHQIYALLTPEQRKQAAEMKAKFEMHPMSNRDGKPQGPRML